MQKMKWVKDEDPADLDEDDIVAFEGLRKVKVLRYLSAVANFSRRT